MPQFRHRLRVRVATALALACILVTGGLGFILYTASESLEETLVRQLITQEMGYLIGRHRQDPGFVPRAAANVQSYIVRDPKDRERMHAWMRELDVGYHEVFVGEEEFHVLVREVNGVRYFVAYEVGLYEQREREFHALLLLSILAAALISLALGYWLSRILVSQVTELAHRVEQIKPGSIYRRLERPDHDREVALLAHALDDYQARIEQMIQREQEFTANVSHELRTPLTAIRTSCELLLVDPALAAKSRARVIQVNEAAGRIAQQIQALLLLARGRALGEVEPVVLAECVTEAVEPFRPDCARKGLTLELAVPDEAVIDLNYEALRIVLTNLISNAVQCTERGFVRVDYASNCLSVTDSGRGIGDEDLPRVFERFFRVKGGAGGTGLGLSIVKRVCDHCGWHIKLRSIPAQGSTFSILFP
jgi:signal transduction histidine kinase